MWRQKQKDGTTVLAGGLGIGDIVSIMYPINSILITTDNVNPGTRFGGTTWAAFGAGRALVGVGNNGTNTYTAEQTFGADTCTLTAAQCSVNDHDHAVNINSGYISADHTHALSIIQKSNTGTYTGGDNAGASVSQGNNTGRFNASISGQTGGVQTNHYHNVSGNTGAVNTPPTPTSHDIRQTSIAVYLWKRTA